MSRIKKALTATGVIAPLVLAGLLTGGTLSTWTDSETIVAAEVTNGNLEIVEVGSLDVVPGSYFESEGEDADGPCEDGWTLAEEHLSNNVTLGSGDRSISARVPIAIEVEGDNLKAEVDLTGNVEVTGDKSRFDLSPIKLYDLDMKEVSEVTSGTYYAAFSISRNGETSISEKAQDKLIVKEINVSLNQVR